MTDKDISLDEDIAALMGPRGPFEVTHVDIGGQAQKVFKTAPPNLVAIFDRARAFGDMDFIIAGESRLTFSEFLDQSERLAVWLLNKGGITKGACVAIVMKNTPEWMIAFAAIIQVGAVAVLVNSRGEGETLKHAVDDGEAVLAIGDDARLRLLREAGCALPMVTTGTLSGAWRFDEVLSSEGTGEWAGDNAEGESHFWPEVLPEDSACMYFTSGTTGRAKAALISHRALVTGTMNTQMAMAGTFIKMAKAFGVSVDQLKAQMPQGCNLLVFPLFHTSGCSAVFLAAVTNGGKLVLMDRWDAENALRLVESEKITSLGGVPTMLWDILKADGLKTCDLSSLASISCGGQALPQHLLRALKEAFPRAIFGAGYGMTETSGAVSQASGELFMTNPTSAGQKLPMIDMRIVKDDGSDVPNGTAGEIWVRGATLMQGYHGRPDDTAAAFDNGWFKTGDIGYRDDAGLLYIVDRKTDMVISGGENIYCAEVEKALEGHPDIEEIAAFGIPDDRLGECLVVCARTENPDCTPDDLLAYAKTRLASYKTPTQVRFLSQAFPRNAMGKIIKAPLKECFNT